MPCRVQLGAGLLPARWRVGPPAERACGETTHPLDSRRSAPSVRRRFRFNPLARRRGAGASPASSMPGKRLRAAAEASEPGESCGAFSAHRNSPPARLRLRAAEGEARGERARAGHNPDRPKLDQQGSNGAAPPNDAAAFAIVMIGLRRHGLNTRLLPTGWPVGHLGRGAWRPNRQVCSRNGALYP